MLSACWPDMSEFERESAVRQLAGMLRELHSVPVPAELPPVDDPPQLLDPVQFKLTGKLLAQLDALERDAEQTGVDTRLIADARHLVLETEAALDPFPTTTLIHGDLHFQNVLWDGFSVTAILDLEWARGAPPDLDLDVFLRFCAHPHWFVAPEYAERTRVEDYAAVPYWLAANYPELFAHEYELERTELYSIAYDVHDLAAEVDACKKRNERAIEGSTRDLPEWHPHKRLENTIFSKSHLRSLAGYKAWDAPDFGEPMPGPPPLAPSAELA
jgi:aminoglycoside phosphotransferase (APT) family kinase protein